MFSLALKVKYSGKPLQFIPSFAYWDAERSFPQSTYISKFSTYIIVYNEQVKVVDKYAN